MNLRVRRQKEPDTARYGEIGSRIPGSVFVRGYCPCCGEPVRITKEEADKQISDPSLTALAKDCAECRAALHPGHGSSATHADDEAVGGWNRAVKNYEGDHS